MTGVGKNRVDQPRMIEHRVARFGVAQQIDQRNVIVLRTRQRAHDEIEIRRGEPRPTIRPDHRGADYEQTRCQMARSSCSNYEESAERFAATNDFVRPRTRSGQISASGKRAHNSASFNIRVVSR